MMNANTTHEKELTGYPSIDKPWLKYYSEEAINAPLPECTIYEYLWENNKDYLDDIALIYFGKKITYGELLENIDKAARAFLSLGLNAVDVCTVVSISCVNSVIVFYALNKIGAISNYINAIASEDEFRTYFSEARSKCIVTLDLFAEKVIKSLDASVTKNVVVFSLADYMPKMTSIGYKLKFPKINLEYSNCIMWSDFISKSANSESDEFKHGADTVSIWAHTGGTTGFPKTVLLTDKAYNSVVMQYMQSMRHKRGEVFLNIIIPFVVYGMLTCLHMPLCLGLTVVIIPKFEAKDWIKYITVYHPNHIAGIPSYYSPMLCDPNFKSMDLSEIITFAAGGDGLNEHLENDLNAFLHQHGSKAQLIKGYGMTEVCSSAVTAFGDYSKIGSVGIPLVKNNIKAYDAEKKCECKYGEVGEIMLSSPSLMVCYKNNDKETNDLISVDDNNTQWIHTGDLGYIDEQGFLFLMGRIKRVIFVGPEGMAYKIFPKTIEDVIVTVQDILDTCVVSTMTANGFAPLAFLVVKHETTKSSEEIISVVKETCDTQLPDYLHPFDYAIIDELPKTSIGKIDYGALEKMAENRQQGE